MCSGMVVGLLGLAFRHLDDPQALLPSFGIWQGQREGFVPLHPIAVDMEVYSGGSTVESTAG